MCFSALPHTSNFLLYLCRRKLHHVLPASPETNKKRREARAEANSANRKFKDASKEFLKDVGLPMALGESYLTAAWDTSHALTYGSKSGKVLEDFVKWKAFGEEELDELMNYIPGADLFSEQEHAALEARWEIDKLKEALASIDRAEMQKRPQLTSVWKRCVQYLGCPLTEVFGIAQRLRVCRADIHKDHEKWEDSPLWRAAFCNELKTIIDNPLRGGDPVDVLLQRRVQPIRVEFDHVHAHPAAKGSLLCRATSMPDGYPSSLPTWRSHCLRFPHH
jgi:hypothetical protein